MDEEIGCTPPELREVAENTLNNLLPKKSREAYEKEFGNFNCWCNENNVKMQYEEEGERLADTSACAGVRADLKMCLLNSDCVKKDKRTPRECLNVDMVPTECQALRNTFMECKRSMLDHRTRFKGRKGY